MQAVQHVQESTLEEVVMDLLRAVAEAKTLIEVNIAAGLALQALLGIQG